MSSMRRPRLRSVLSVLAIALSSGCVALIHDDASSNGPHCRFAGDDSTACGMCLAANCQEPIDACCDPDSYECAYELDTIERCASEGRCVELQASGDAGTNTPRQIEVCATEHCNRECGIDPLRDGGAEAAHDAGTTCLTVLDVGACGDCAFASCSAFLTSACCNDTDCADYVRSLIQCTEASDCSCTGLYFDQSPKTLEQELASCISLSCGNACLAKGCAQ